MVVLPDPPANLPPAPRAFYARLRAARSELQPADVYPAGLEMRFGDGGAGIAHPPLREPEWGLGAQVSRRAAVVFAGPVTEHFSDAAGGDWTDAAADLVARVLRGDLQVPVVLRGRTVVRVGGE